MSRGLNEVREKPLWELWEKNAQNPTVGWLVAFREGQRGRWLVLRQRVMGEGWEGGQRPSGTGLCSPGEKLGNLF